MPRHTSNPETTQAPPAASPDATGRPKPSPEGAPHEPPARQPMRRTWLSRPRALAEGRWCPMHAPDREADEALLRLQPQPEPQPDPDTYQPLDGLPPQTAAAVERYRQLKEQR